MKIVFSICLLLCVLACSEGHKNTPEDVVNVPTPVSENNDTANVLFPIEDLELKIESIEPNDSRFGGDCFVTASLTNKGERPLRMLHYTCSSLLEAESGDFACGDVNCNVSWAVFEELMPGETFRQRTGLFVRGKDNKTRMIWHVVETDETDYPEDEYGRIPNDVEKKVLQRVKLYSEEIAIDCK